MDLKHLSDSEKEYVLKILKDISSGDTSSYEELIYNDYEEIPVTVEEFLHNEKYLGKGLINEEGKFTVYPYWEETLKKIFPNNIDPPKYNTLALTGCLGYDTLIPLLNGEKVKIGDLASLEHLDTYVYSFDIETDEFVPGHLIDAFSTGIKPIYRITLDSGESFEATSNHKFMLRNKKWKSIDSGLSVGDSLLPLYREYKPISKDKNTLYEYIKHPKKDGSYKEEKTHRMVMRNKIGEFKGVVHHKDFNPLNNDPSNLLKTDWISHKMYHAKLGGMRWKELGRKRKNKEIPEELELRMREGARKGGLTRWSNPEEHEKMRKLTTERMLNGFAKHRAELYWNGANSEENRKQRALDLANYNKDPKNINKYQISKAVKISNLALLNYGYLSEETYEKTKLDYNMRCGYPSYKSALNRISKEELLDLAKNYNHKIQKIEFLGYKEVFDLTVEKYHNFALDCGIVAHNSIGIGKSFMATLCMLYELYRMLCLKDPYIHYGLQPIDKITFAVMNITLDAARGVMWDKMQQLLQTSDWFMSHGTVSGNTNVEWHPPKGIELIAGSLSRHIIGRAVFMAAFDEVSFQPNQDVEKQKEKAKNLVNTASARMQSRFMKGEKNPTLLILMSSKRTEQSYMESFIEQKRRAESKTTYIVDEPQWVIRTDKDSTNKFLVAVGNKFLTNEVVPLDATPEELKLLRDKGYTLLEVPMGYYESFIDDIDIALTDIAGISTTMASKYISGARLANVKKAELQNPFIKDIIEVGNAQDDLAQYSDFFDMSKIDRNMLSRPMFIHLDMSISGDKTGIAGVWIKGKKPHQEGVPDSRELYYQLAFSVSIKAPKGHQVSFEKNRQFIYWLREQGFAIKGVSADSFQSTDLLQQLSARGFKTEIISVDRLTDHVCLPYQYFKNVIYDGMIEMYDSVLLTDEIINLERNNSTGKVDHPMGGTVGSKDASDAVCGALWNASKHGEEFAFDFGETLDLISETNSDSVYDERTQITIDFEEALKEVKNPLGIPNKKDDGFGLDFGFGKAQQTLPNSYYMADGIVVW